MARPLSSFHGFIGHRKQVRFLQRQLQGAQARGQPFPHLLLIGQSGIGKTTLARALAAEYGSNCQHGAGKESPAQLCEYLTSMKPSMKPNDFLFLDEAHKLGRDSQELLYQVIDDGAVKDYLGERTEESKNAKRTEDGKLVIPKVTVLLATNQPGELLQALLGRMELTVTLDNYNQNELTEIGSGIAADLGLLISTQALGVVARAAQGLPRNVKHHLRGMDRHFVDARERELRSEDVRRYFRDANIGDHGLDQTQQKYLSELDDRDHVSLDTLANLLGPDRDFVASRIEPALVKLGYVSISQTGRQLTPKGKKWVKTYLRPEVGEGDHEPTEVEGQQ